MSGFGLNYFVHDFTAIVGLIFMILLLFFTGYSGEHAVWI